MIFDIENFVSPVWKLHNPYCHTEGLELNMTKIAVQITKIWPSGALLKKRAVIKKRMWIHQSVAVLLIFTHSICTQYSTFENMGFLLSWKNYGSIQPENFQGWNLKKIWVSYFILSKGFATLHFSMFQP